MAERAFSGGVSVSMMRWGFVVLSGALLAALAGGTLGWASRAVFLVGVLPLATGVAAGFGVTLAAAVTRGPWGRPALAAAAVAVVVGWGAFQVFEDHHFQEVFSEAVSRSRLAGANIAPGTFDHRADKAFLAPDAGALLADQVLRRTGLDGPVGRLVYRADAGIRLFGSHAQSRGLPVGRVGGLLWYGVQVLLAWLVARAVVRRGHARLEPASATRETEDLDQEREAR